MGELPPPVGNLKKPKSGMSLFSKKPAPAPTGSSPDLSNAITSLSRRVSMLEERYENQRRKVELIEENLLSTQQKIFSEIRSANSEIMAFKEKMKDMQDKMLMLINEIGLLSKKEDVDVLKRYIEMWDPVKFMTREQVERIIHQTLDEKGY